MRELLAEVPTIKRFAERHGLRPTSSYAKYAEVPRSAIVWVVSASTPLSFQPRTWTFPIVGSVPYLGWFDEAEARDFADDLRSQGYDVDLRGAQAYSTLGWFDDPILSTMLGSGDEAVGDLANVVLHESVHATYYLPGQSPLNESVADFLGDRLATAYLRERTGENSDELRAYLEGSAGPRTSHGRPSPRARGARRALRLVGKSRGEAREEAASSSSGCGRAPTFRARSTTPPSRVTRSITPARSSSRSSSKRAARGPHDFCFAERARPLLFFEAASAGPGAGACPPRSAGATAATVERAADHRSPRIDCRAANATSRPSAAGACARFAPDGRRFGVSGRFRTAGRNGPGVARGRAPRRRGR